MSVTDVPDWVQSGELLAPPVTADSPDWIRAVFEVAPTSANVDYPDWTEVMVVYGANLPVSSPPGGATFWYDATRIVGVSPGSGVASVNDSSGNGHTWTVPSGGTAAIYETSGPNTLNGHPSLYFPGVSTNHSPAYKTASLTIPQPMTIAMALSTTSQVWNQSLWDDSANEVPFGFLSATSSTPSVFGNAGQATFGSGLSSGGTGHSLILLFQGTSTVMYVDGTLVNPSTTTIGTSGITTGLLFGATDPAQCGNGFNGVLGEFLVYPFALAAAQATALHTYFANKWGVP